MSRLTNRGKLRPPAKGFVLLLIVLTLLAISGILVLNKIGGSVNSSQRQNERAQASNDVLLAAKAALLGYVTQKVDGGSGYRLGNLPTPDILNATGTAIQYDGLTDGSTVNKCLSPGANGLPGVSPGTSSRSSTQRCLGKFPWRTFSLDVGNPDPGDVRGQIPWMAISANLNYWDNCLGVLNSDTLNASFSAGTSCPVASNLIPYQWMTVVDQFGNTLSNRVAAVLIMPGSPIETGGRIQDRSPTSPRFPGYPIDFLDKISLPIGCVSSCTAIYDNADLTNTFIQIPAGTRYPDNSENTSLAGQPVAFNDILIYITIDELMPYIERRVLSEMSAAIKDSKSKTTTYPWAASFMAPSSYSQFMSSAGVSFGLFPFFNSSISTPYQSNFDWQINGITALGKSCVRVMTGPNRYVDINQYLKADFYSGTTNSGNASGAASTCLSNAIPASGTATLDCTYTSNPTLLNKAFALYSNSTCTTVAAGSPANYTITRSINAAPSVTCNVGSISYLPADSTRTQRMTWTCTPASGSTFSVTAIDTITTTASPFSQTGSFSVNGANKSVVISNLRYQPIMPTWFYNNEWYLTAFFSVAPSKAPSLVLPCGSTTLLTSGNNQSVDALVMLAGSRLPNLPNSPTQNRPSSGLSDYLESPSVTGGTNCVFSTVGGNATNAANDQVLVVAP